MFLNINKQQTERIWMLAKIDFRQRYYEHKAGMLWALMKPIADSLIFYFVFKYIMHNNIPNFSLYLFIGLCISGIFGECTSGKIHFLAEKKSLYEYSNMNKSEIYLSSIIANFIGFFFNLIVLFVLSIFIGKDFYYSIHAILLPVFILSCFVLCLCWTVIVSTIYLFARDISQIWQILFTVFFWSSPVVLDQILYDNQFKLIAYIHPFSSVLICLRDVLFYHTYPNFHHSMALIVSMTAWSAVAILMFKKLTPYASEKL